MFNQIENMLDAYDRGRINRRDLVVRLAAAAATGIAGTRMLSGARAPAGDPQDESGRATSKPAADDRAHEATFEATGVDHVALSVTDVARSREFYQRHLGLTVTSAGRQSSFLRCGADFLALFQASEPGLHHFSFGLEDYDADRAIARLKRAGLDHHRESNRVYFKDPDGLTVQVSPQG